MGERFGRGWVGVCEKLRVFMNRSVGPQGGAFESS